MGGMTSVLLTLNDWFWNDAFWLPPGVDWKAIEPADDNDYPVFNEMYKPILYAFGVILVRIAFEWSVGTYSRIFPF